MRPISSLSLFPGSLEVGGYRLWNEVNTSSKIVSPSLCRFLVFATTLGAEFVARMFFASKTNFQTSAASVFQFRHFFRRTYPIAVKKISHAISHILK